MTRTPTARTERRAARPASRREDIADAAIDLFLERGVAATRVEDILTAAGVSVGSFYHHFGDKLSLAATVYLEHLQRFQGDLLVELDRHARTEDAVRGMVLAFLRWAGADPRAMRYMHHCRESSVVEISEGEEARLKQGFYGRLTDWLGEHTATGELRALPPEHSLALWLGPAEQLVRAVLDPFGHMTAPDQDTLVAHLTNAEQVLADAAWEALRRPAPSDDADHARQQLAVNESHHNPRRPGATTQQRPQPSSRDRHQRLPPTVGTGCMWHGTEAWDFGDPPAQRPQSHSRKRRP